MTRKEERNQALKYRQRKQVSYKQYSFDRKKSLPLANAFLKKQKKKTSETTNKRFVTKIM